MSEEKTNWGTILIAFLSFILGLISSLFVQWWSDRKRLKRIKGAVQMHLKDIILKDCDALWSEYERIVVTIQKLHLGSVGFKAFETFDAEIYKANNPSDYFKIYGSRSDKFEKLVSIYAIISFLKENLPNELYSDYVNEINSHLDSNVKNDESRVKHFNTCTGCDNIRSNYIATGNLRLDEVKKLKELIGKLLQN